MADNEPREETLEQRIKRWARDGVTLGSGKVVQFDPFAVRLNEFRKLADTTDQMEARQIGDKLIAEAFGLTIDEVQNLPLVDFKVLDAVISAMTINPVAYNPN